MSVNKSWFGLTSALLFLALAAPVDAQERVARNIQYLPLESRPVAVRQQQDPAPYVQDDESPSDRPQATQELPTLADVDVRQPIMELEFGINNEPGTVPEDESDEFTGVDPSSNHPGLFQDRIAMWRAPDIRYQPLYFNDVNLERYGYRCGGDFFQPFASGIHFGLSTVMLVPNMCCQHPGSCDYPLGFCQPGSCAPETKTRWLWKPYR